jgi:N6-adenosine-specific RNA methylase IME4
MKPHQYADLFPMMGEAEYAALLDSMRSGYDETVPIVTYQGQILDGRNRYRAANELGITPPFTEYTGDDPLGFVIRHNLTRRHLNESQRAMVASRLATMTRGAEGGNQRAAKNKSANLRICFSDTTLEEEHESAEDHTPELPFENAEPPAKKKEKQHEEKPADAPEPEISQKDAAAMLNVSERSIQYAKAVTRNAPELIPLIDSGAITVSLASQIANMPPEQREKVIRKIVEEGMEGAKAIREVQKEERRDYIKEQKRQIEESPPVALPTKYNVIVIDPPWAYGTQYDPAGRRVANPYPEMSQSELLALALPSAEDCVMFLWTTHRFIWDAKELMDKWGFTYRSMIVWDKEKIGMGDLFRMQCEFCIVGIKGKPMFDNNHTWRDIIREPRREHSRKPESFYSMVDSLCVGHKLDFFSRTNRAGWDVVGNESGRFNQ